MGMGLAVLRGSSSEEGLGQETRFPGTPPRISLIRILKCQAEDSDCSLLFTPNSLVIWGKITEQDSWSHQVHVR